MENGPFGLKKKANEPNRLSGPIRTTPEAKNGQKFDFLRKTAPRDPRRTSAAPLTPIGAGRGLRILIKSAELHVQSWPGLLDMSYLWSTWYGGPGLRR